MSAREELNKIKDSWGLQGDAELADKLKTSKSNIDSWVKRDKIPEKWTLKIGQMHQENQLSMVGDNLVSINFYPDIYAAAGYGSINEYGLNPEVMTFDKRFLQEMLNARSLNNLDIIRVMGDSMEPFIQNGEYVILERSQEALNGETVIANIHGQVYIKRFHADPFKKWIKLVSDNEVYGDITLDTQEHMNALSIVGIVRAKIKPF